MLLQNLTRYLQGHFKASWLFHINLCNIRMSKQGTSDHLCLLYQRTSRGFSVKSKIQNFTANSGLLNLRCLSLFRQSCQTFNRRFYIIKYTFFICIILQFYPNVSHILRGSSINFFYSSYAANSILNG